MATLLPLYCSLPHAPRQQLFAAASCCLQLPPMFFGVAQHRVPSTSLLLILRPLANTNFLTRLIFSFLFILFSEQEEGLSQAVDRAYQRRGPPTRHAVLGVCEQGKEGRRRVEPEGVSHTAVCACLRSLLGWSCNSALVGALFDVRTTDRQRVRGWLFLLGAAVVVDARGCRDLLDPGHSNCFASEGVNACSSLNA